MGISSMSEDEDITWRFTVKNGAVEKIGPAQPVAPIDIMKTDEEGQPYMRIHIPDPEMCKAISQAVCDQFGKDVSGAGFYHEGDSTLEFKPEKRS
jgi:hypothetical protein